MADVLIAAAFVPSPPLLVPELAGRDASATDELRAAVLGVADALSGADRWLVVGADDHPSELEADTIGTFAGYGADVRVALGPDTTGEPDPTVPLVALLGGWLRERVASTVPAEVLVVARDVEPHACVRLGRELRTQLDSDTKRTGLLVVGDGAATLTDKAPGSFDERAGAVEDGLAAALRDGRTDALTALDPELCARIRLDGRAAWQVLAGVFEHAPSSTRIAYCGAPFGVGYHAGVWTP